jgi:hypothetical protein
VWLQEAGLHPDLLSFLESDESPPIIEQLHGNTTGAPSLLVSAAANELAAAVDSLQRSDNTFHAHSFQFDLISAVNRQLKFAAKMTSFAWRHSPFFHATLTSAITRYQHFFQMMKEHSQLAPTVDVDLVWHTHQLTPFAYWEYSREVAGRFINHNDMINEEAASLSFHKTVKAYEKIFRESYSLCFCWLCESSRHSERPVEETVQTVKKSMEIEIARRRNTGLLVDVVFAKAHCSRCGFHPTMRCVPALSPVNHTCRRCNEECGCLDSAEFQCDGEECEAAECNATPSACNGQPWCDGCDESESFA